MTSSPSRLPVFPFDISNDSGLARRIEEYGGRFSRCHLAVRAVVVAHPDHLVVGQPEVGRPDRPLSMPLHLAKPLMRERELRGNGQCIHARRETWPGACGAQSGAPDSAHVLLGRQMHEGRHDDRAIGE